MSFHAFFPLLPTKAVYCDAADCTCVQTVWCNTYTDSKHKKRRIDEKREQLHHVMSLNMWGVGGLDNNHLFQQYGTVRVSGLFSFEDGTCLFEDRTWRMSCAWSEQTYRIRQGWSVECRNFEPHRFYRRCVSQHECWTCMLSDYLTPGKEMINRFF